MSANLQKVNHKRHDFFNTLYQHCDAGKIDLRAFPSKKTGLVSPDSLKEIDRFCKLCQKDNLYFGVALRAGGHTKEHITEIPAVWADVDYKDCPREEFLKKLKKFPFRPSVTVSSGGGIHLYWILKEPAEYANTERVEAVNRKIATALGGDMSTFDASRILRIPDTVNRKPGRGNAVCIVESIQDFTYDLEDFEILPEPDVAVSGTEYDKTAQSENLEKIMSCVFMQHCRKDAATLPEPEWYAMITQLARDQGGVSFIHRLSKPHPKYSKKEVDSKILHALNDTGPETCERIKQKWNCGKDCTVKSPAALVYQTSAVIEFDAPIPFDGIETPQIDPAIIPNPVRDYCLAVSEHAQTPFELALVGCLGAFSTVAQGKFRVHINGGYSEPVNMYLACQLSPGERKSAVIGRCKKSLTAWQMDQGRLAEPEIKRLSQKKRTLEKMIMKEQEKAAKNGTDIETVLKEIEQLEDQIPEIPVKPRLLADDFTAEALAEVLQNHDERLGVIEAEAGIFETLAGRYSGGVPNIDLVLKSWSGEPVVIDRRQKQAISLRNPSLSICIALQPEIIRELSAKPGFKGRGLIGRFLFFIPKSKLGSRSFQTSSISEELERGYTDALRKILNLEWNENEWGEKREYPIHLTKDAFSRWKDFAETVEKELGPGGEFEYMTDWAGKLTGQAIRLAGIFHIITHPKPQHEHINGEVMQSALDLAAVLTQHARAAYELMGADKHSEFAKDILKWIKREEIEGFTGRDCMYKFRGRKIRMETDVTPALNVLIERNFLRHEEGKSKGPGRPKQVFHVNCAVHDE